MEDDSKKIRFRNGGKKYVAEFIGDNFMSEKSPNGLIIGVAIFRIWDEHQKKVFGCVSFTVSLLVGLARTGFPTQYKVEALVNLLHYLPFDQAKCESIYPSCYEYRFDSGLDEDTKEDGLYRIKADDSFESIFQRLIFGTTLTNRSIQDAALEVMFNDWEDHPDTNVLVETLANILPVAEVNLIKNLKLLLNEGKIHAVTSPGDPQKLISVGLEPTTIRGLEGEVETAIQYPQMVKNIYGTNIENLTTHGNNSPINISVGDINTAFGDIIKQIEEKEFEGKKEVLESVNELQVELGGNKDPKKVKGLIDKIKGKAVWVYNLIFKNPVLTAYLTQLLLGTL